MDIIKSICYNFEADKNEVLTAIQTQKKATSWRKSEGSKIVEYNDQLMNQTIFAEVCGGTFQLPGVIYIVLKDKHSGFLANELDSTAKKLLNNKVHERALVVLFIDNANRRI